MALARTVSLLALTWLVSAAHLGLQQAGFAGLVVLGIHPGSWLAVWTPFTAPFVHASWPHLIGNTVHLVVLLPLAFLAAGDRAWSALIWGAVGGAALIHVFGAPGTVHLGASIAVFALIGYLGLVGLVHKRFGLLLVSILIVFLYFGAVLTVLHDLAPSGERVSWQGHLGGLLGGIAGALWLPPPAKGR